MSKIAKEIKKILYNKFHVIDREMFINVFQISSRLRFVGFLLCFPENVKKILKAEMDKKMTSACPY